MATDKSSHHDPGWNDPPTFSYDQANAIQASAIKKGTSLNKRVPFPMNSKVSVTNSDSSFPPKSIDMAGPPKMVPNSEHATKQLETASQNLDKSEMLDKALDSLKNTDCYRVNSDVSKRIEILEQMWRDDKISDVVKQKIFDYCEALSNGKIETADHIQKGLIVDHASQCSPWISGLRHIILDLTSHRHGNQHVEETRIEDK